MKYLLIFLLTIASSAHQDILAKTIHALLLIDVEDKLIKESCEQDKINMIEHINRMALSYGQDAKIVVLEKEKFTKKYVLSALEKLKSFNDDTFIFYFSGHGYWADNQGFVLQLRNKKKTNFDAIKYKIESRKNGLNIILTDSCKEYIPGTKGRGTYSTLSVPVINSNINKNFRHLLDDYQGTLIAMSCRANQESYATDDGGFFTISFLDAMSHYVEYEDPTWSAIMSLTRNKTRKKAFSMRRIQIPDIDTSTLALKGP